MNGAANGALVEKHLHEWDSKRCFWLTGICMNGAVTVSLTGKHLDEST